MITCLKDFNNWSYQNRTARIVKMHALIMRGFLKLIRTSSLNNYA